MAANGGTADMRPRRPAPGRRAAYLAGLLGVLGPGLIAGLSDDDPAGITTYSMLGASYGYTYLWVLTVSTVALILFHLMGARIGVVTGQGMAGLIRQRYGARAGVLSIGALVLANIGTTAAEFAGIAAGGEIFHVPRHVSVPTAAIVVTLLVFRGKFKVVERVLLTLSAVFLAYIGAGVLAGPDWGAAFVGMVVPVIPGSRDAILLCTATLGTTLAPWGLAFMQSYAVDKKVTPNQMGLMRVDVVTGAVMTGVIGFFVVVACAATLWVRGISITDASSAAVALEPLAGPLASQLFAVGLIGAALLAASILPLSTAYSVTDIVGARAAIDDSIREAPLFYGTYTLLTLVGVGLVLIPGLPLVQILVGTQVINAVLLLPLLVYLTGIARDRDLMGEHAASRAMVVLYGFVIALIALCVVVLGVLSVVPS